MGGDDDLSDFPAEGARPRRRGLKLKSFSIWSGIVALLLASLNLATIQGRLDAMVVVTIPLAIAALLALTPDHPSIGRRLAWAFLIALEVGSLISAFPRIFPHLKDNFPGLAPGHARMLSWYVGLHSVYMLCILPPYFAARWGRERRAGNPNAFSPFAGCFCYVICVFTWPVTPFVLAQMGFWPIM